MDLTKMFPLWFAGSFQHSEIFAVRLLMLRSGTRWTFQSPKDQFVPVMRRFTQSFIYSQQPTPAPASPPALGAFC